MKISRTDAHDRFSYLQQQADYISQGIEDCKTKNSLGEALLASAPYMYVYAHKREIGTDERFSLWMNGFYSSLADVPTARLLWQPRLRRPAPELNSMLFKVYPHDDIVKIIWMIPQQELWEQYEKGKMTESQIIYESIDQYKKDPKKLEYPDDEDLSDEAIQKIYARVAHAIKTTKPEIAD